MRALLVVVCALAACGDGPQVGALIEVVAPAELGVLVDEVKLFTGLPGALGTLEVSPAGFVAAGLEPLTAAAYQRDLAGSTVDRLAIGPDGNATFQFEPGGSADALGAVIAVGYATDGAGARTMTAAGALYDITLSTEHLRVYTLTLAPAYDPAEGPAPVGPAIAVRVWGVSTTERETECVYIDDPAEAAARQPVVLIEDPADQDCDGYTAQGGLECAPAVFGAVDAPPAEPSCVVVEAVQIGGLDRELCRAGGPTCTDGVGTAPGSCGAGPFCLQASLCASCTEAALDPAAAFRCLATLTQANSSSSYTYLHLTAPYTTDVSNGLVFAQGDAMFAAGARLPGMVTCKRIEFVTPEGALRGDLDLGAVKLAASITTTCDVTVKVTHGSVSGDLLAPAMPLLAIGLEDSTGAALNTLLVPLEVKAVATDTVPVSLSLVGGLAESADVLACLIQP